MEKKNQEVVDVTENILTQFIFDKYDKIEIEGLDSLIALQLEEIEEIQKCEIQTKVLKEGNVATETYVLVIWKGDEQNPLTFKSMTSRKK